MKSNTDNFENIANHPDIEIGLSDPNRTSPNLIEGGSFNIPMNGAFKKTKTDMSGPSGQATGSNYEESISSMKARMPERINDVSLPQAKEIDVLTFGDPNDTSLDFKDGKNPNTVTIRGGAVGDITHYGFNGPAFPDK